MAKAKGNNELRVTSNKVDIIGKLQSNDLKFNKDNKGNYVNGSVLVKYGSKADDCVQLDVYVSEFKKDGSKTKSYADILDICNNGVSMSKATEENPASIVRADGNFPFAPKVDFNEYAGKDGVQGTTKISLGFAKLRFADFEQKDFCGDFEMTVRLAENPKKNADDQLELKCYYVSSAKNSDGEYVEAIKPIEFIVEDEEIVDGMEDVEEFVKGATVQLWGNAKVAKIISHKEKKSGFGGKAKTETTEKTTRKLVVDGGDMVAEESKEWLDDEFVKRLLVERETFLEELKKGKDKKPAKKASGFGGSGSSKPKKKIDGDDDIPF